MRSCTRRLASVCLLSILSAAPAAAQFKPKLSKLNPLAKKEAAATRAPAFNDRVLEITDERVGRLLQGYAAETAAIESAEREQATARAAYEQEMKRHPGRLQEYEKQHRAWQSCQDQVVKPAEAKAQAELRKSQDEITGGDEAAFERRLQELQQRIQAAQAEGNMGEVMRLADSLQQSVGTKSGTAAMKASADMQAAGSKCGPEPVRPQPPTPPASNTANLDATGAKAAGLTEEQYAILKERTQAALDEDGRVQVPSSSWAFSGDELAVLEKRGAELQRAYAPVLERGL